MEDCGRAEEGGNFEGSFLGARRATPVVQQAVVLGRCGSAQACINRLIKCEWIVSCI